MLQNAAFLDPKLCKLIKTIRIRGWRFLEVGNDVNLGSPMLDVSRTEPSAEMEDLEVWKLSEDGGRTSSNKLVLKLGMSQLQQYQLTSLTSNYSYTAVFM